jgi:hypothetical protein
MPFETDWALLLNRTIVVHPFVSENSAGRRTYGSSRNVAARIRDDVRTWRWKDGTERQSRAMVYFSDSAVGPYDKIMLPAGYDPQEAIVVWFQRHDDEFGYHHSEVFV